MASALGNILRFLCIFLVANLVLTQQTTSGPCPNVTGQSNLNLNQLMGFWYKIRTFNWGWSPCTRDLFSRTSNGDITAVITFGNVTSPQRRTLYIEFDLTQSSKFYAYTDQAKTELFGIFVVIYADSTSTGCAALFSCIEGNSQDHYAIITVICRTIQPTNAQIQPALTALTNQGLGGYPLTNMDQSISTCGLNVG